METSAVQIGKLPAMALPAVDWHSAPIIFRKIFTRRLSGFGIISTVRASLSTLRTDQLAVTSWATWRRTHPKPAIGGRAQWVAHDTRAQSKTRVPAGPTSLNIDGICPRIQAQWCYNAEPLNWRGWNLTRIRMTDGHATFHIQRNGVRVAHQAPRLPASSPGYGNHHGPRPSGAWFFYSINRYNKSEN